MQSFFKILAIGSMAISIAGCSKSFLDEVPVDSLSPENAWTNVQNFDMGINALYATARAYIATDHDGTDYWYRDYLRVGTDVAQCAQPSRSIFLVDYNTLNSNSAASRYFWNNSYTGMIFRSNTLIHRARIANFVWDDAARNRIIAEARFMRAYAYYIMANLFGDVPLITEETEGIRYDYTRTDKNIVLDTVRKDLEFASQWLPKDPDTVPDGRLTQAAADQLLATLYLQLQLPDLAIAATSRTIDSSGKYQLMTERFGNTNRPGDVFSDLFWDAQQNRKSGNKESIWVLQFEYNTNGGGDVTGLNRVWGPVYLSIKDPKGGIAMVQADSLGRPIGIARTTNYFNYDIWQYDTTDMRNSPYNIRRKWYYNDPASPYFGQLAQIYTGTDTMFQYYPMIRKTEGFFQDIGFGTTANKDWMVYRLAETYLLRAEAYLQKGDKERAAADINKLRSRAHAHLVSPSEVSINFILDERARELIIEEPRRLTLARLGLWYERTKQYALLDVTKNSIQPYHNLFPVPQNAIDINLNGVLEQNPGY